MTTPNQVPDQLLAGDTWEWSREYSDYPAPTWSGVYYFERADANFSANATASGSSFAVTVPAATTAAYRAGRYRWRLLVTNGSTRKMAAEGWVDVLPDPAAAGNVDHRTTARVMLDNIEAYLRDPTNLVMANWSIGGRALSRWSRADLIAERERLQAEVRREETEERLRSGIGQRRNRVAVRFGRG